LPKRKRKFNITGASLGFQIVVQDAMTSERSKILDNLDGIWGLDDNSIRMEILPNKVLLRTRDVNLSFDNHAAWDEKSGLLVFNNTPYFVESADRETLVFGKLVPDTMPFRIQWKVNLQRTGMPPSVAGEHDSCRNNNDVHGDLREML
jgi:hypothetical protein